MADEIKDLIEAIAIQVEVTRAHTACMSQVNEKLTLLLTGLQGANATREKWYLIIILTLIVALGAAAGIKIGMPTL